MNLKFEVFPLLQRNRCVLRRSGVGGKCTEAELKRNGKTGILLGVEKKIGVVKLTTPILRTIFSPGNAGVEPDVFNDTPTTGAKTAEFGWFLRSGLNFWGLKT
jgi:hypothetical protein